VATVFGLDFGTTNSLVSFVQEDRELDRSVSRPLMHLADGRPHPSVVWYSAERPIVGREARDQMSELGIGVFGDIVRSPKRYLGGQVPIVIGDVPRSAVDVVGEVLSYLREDALGRGFPEQDFSRAVMTVPVSMTGRARCDLREAANRAGIQIHQFVHEPMAALYGYLRGMPTFQAEVARLEGRVVLVYDWGGGTLDLTLCRIEQHTIVQILNLGEPLIGGDQFDLRLLDIIKAKHIELHPEADWGRMQPTADARLLRACEDAKISLSQSAQTNVFLRDVLQGPGSDLEVTVSQAEFRNAVEDLVRGGLSAISKLLERAELPVGALEFCLVTGGMVAMPSIREGLIEILGGSRIREIDNAESVISEGASWIAYDGARVRLAKPIEFLQAGDNYVEIVPAHTDLPQAGEQIRQVMSLYCVDPRDGFAKVQIARPRWPGRANAVEDRVPYACLCVDVDPKAAPLGERLELKVVIDEDLIANVGAVSSLSRFYKDVDIHDLEFGLGLGSNDVTAEGAELPASQEPGVLGTGGGTPKGSVRIRSNVTDRSGDWNSVPGEIAQRNQVGHRLTRRQHDEKMYYEECVECHRNIYLIERDGCEVCAGIRGGGFTRESNLPEED
jgi:molecular chaperone DnaK